VGSPGYWIRPGEARPPDPDLPGLDPLALRLALLRCRYRADADLTPDDLKAAGETLQHWRALVARYALSGSKPMCAQYTGEFLGALDDDLDTPAALRILSALAADQAIPDGSKFESFAYADRFLGLDLVRDVGR
jgi:cysteinyl-tRNA synthetase